MTIDDTHREDVKAAIRKKYGSITAFQEAHGLYPGAFQDVFSNRAGKRVKAVINQFLAEYEEEQRSSAAA